MPVLKALLFTLLILLAGLCQAGSPTVNRTYIALAMAVYEDSLISAQALQGQIDLLLQKPSAEALAAAREAWRQARAPYQQSETFRFVNPEIDDWEGQLNSWPLDEGLIDYVAEDDYFSAMGNLGAQLNIIANPIISMGGQEIDARNITPELLSSLHEFAGSEANVATGYHAIEFLLWGQDLNGTEPGAGERPFTDFALGQQCTHDHCDRRRAYLKAATELLVQNLQEMVAKWRDGGELYQRYQTLPESEVLANIVKSIGSLSLGELAGERMKVSLEASSTEDEHDCFSDNTHWSHYYNALGMKNLYSGHYTRLSGEVVQGPSLAAAAMKAAPTQAKALEQALETSMQAFNRMVERAEDPKQPMKFDQMIAEGNEQGREIIMNAINALVAQTSALEALAKAMNLDHAG